MARAIASFVSLVGLFIYVRRWNAGQNICSLGTQGAAQARAGLYSLDRTIKKRVNAKDHLAYDALALHTQRSQHVRYIPPDDDVLYCTRFAYITHSAEHKCNYIRLRNQTDFSKQTTSCNTSEENYKYSNIRTHTYIVPESAADGVQALQIEIAYDHREQRVNAIS